MTGQVEGMREYVCAGCGGTVLTVAALRQLEGALAEHLWTEPAAPTGSDQHCPFCTRVMEPKALPAGSAATCKGCQSIWLDKQAVDALPAKQVPTGGPSLASETMRCPQCGAPVAHTWDEKCQFCGSALQAPTKVVIMPESLPGDVPTGREPWRLGRSPSILGSVVERIIEGA
jgi:uncharacterized paraquat-inducible protein A